MDSNCLNQKNAHIDVCVSESCILFILLNASLSGGREENGAPLVIAE